MKGGRRSLAEQTRTRLLDLWSGEEAFGHPLGCVTTSFTFDAGFFEEQCLARFLSIQSNPDETAKAYLVEREEKLSQCFSCVLVDRAHAAPDRSLRWNLLPVTLPRGGVLHAKLTLLVWENCIRVLIGSANLTEPGYRRNQEVMTALDFGPQGNQPPELLAHCVTFLNRVRSLAPGSVRTNAGPQAALAAFLNSVQRRVGSLPPAQRADAECALVSLVPGGATVFNWTKRIYSAQLPFLINPCVGVEPMTHVTKEKEIPTQKEILRMIAAANPGDDRDIFLTCLYTLGRIDEILRLRWHEDVNFEKRYVVLWTRKRKDGAYQPDVLPMNDDLYDVLKKRWENRKQDKWVFWNPIANEGKGDRYKERPKMMWTICKRAGCPPIGTRRVKRSPKQIRAFEKKNKRPIREDERIMTLPKYYGFHSIRHFMASYLMDEHKVSLKTVSGLLRHKAVRTTEIYLHSVDSSALAATDKIRGEFTLKMSEPLRSPATEETKKEKGATE